MEKMIFNPIDEMHAFYRKDDPTEEEQFRFVESMKYLIETAYNKDDISAFSYNLAMYYHNIRNFQLEKKYLELGASVKSELAIEELGILWYYGLCGEINYKKAFHYFSESNTRRSLYMLADMYHYGQYVEKDVAKAREILENLYSMAADDIEDPVNAVYSETVLRLVRLDIEEDRTTEYHLKALLSARKVLDICQQKDPSWENLKTMHRIIETIAELAGEPITFTDLYDLLAFDAKKATVTFVYNGVRQQLDIFPYENEIVYQFDGRWFHGAEDFLEKVRIDNYRITTIFDQISDIQQMGGILRFEFEYIVLSTIDGEVYTGDVLLVDNPSDNDEGTWGLTLETDEPQILFFKESEIWRIKRLRNE